MWNKTIALGMLFLILVSGCIQSVPESIENESIEEPIDVVDGEEHEEQSEERVNGNGILEGTITIGPLCPVVVFPSDPSCEPTEETYAAYALAVWTLDTGTKVGPIEPDAEGRFRIELATGNYTIDFEEERAIWAGGTELPTMVTINAGETTAIHIDIDTGIR